jgi:hypothetical protein
MPNRIIKESICTSDNVDRLSAFHETVFYRLIVNCDDYGRMDARPKILASKLFPLKDIRAAQMEDALRALTSAELVTLYRVGGKPFLQMKTWDRHQSVRAKKSKFPGPDEADAEVMADEVIGHYGKADDGCMQADASKCKQMQANVPVIQSNPIQSESESNPNPTRARGAGGTDFERFWQAYPKKIGKVAAQKALARVKVPVDVLIAAVEKQKQSDQWTRDAGRYIPNAATWLNQGRWEDELPGKDNSKPSGQYQRSGQKLSPMMREYVKQMMEEET